MSHRISKSIAVFALAALAVSAGVSPAEAGKPSWAGGPNKPHGKDTTAPTLTVPANITTSAIVPFGVSVTFSVTVTDDKDPAPALVVSPPSGTMFPVGTTTVTATATDWKGNTSTKTFDVTVQPYAGGDIAYKAYYFDTDGYSWFEWDITLHANGSVSGTGHQTGLLIVYDEWNQYAYDLPAGLSGAGTVSGTVGSNAACTFTSSRNFWSWDGFTVDGNDDPVYTDNVGGFSGAATASTDIYGNLYFSADPLDSPPDFWGQNGAWYRVP